MAMAGYRHVGTNGSEQGYLVLVRRWCMIPHSHAAFLCGYTLLVMHCNIAHCLLRNTSPALRAQTCTVENRSRKAWQRDCV
jgi:hypothetical protein